MCGELIHRSIAAMVWNANPVRQLNRESYRPDIRLNGDILYAFNRQHRGATYVMVGQSVLCDKARPLFRSAGDNPGVFEHGCFRLPADMLLHVGIFVTAADEIDAVQQAVLDDPTVQVFDFIARGQAGDNDGIDQFTVLVQIARRGHIVDAAELALGVEVLIEVVKEKIQRAVLEQSSQNADDAVSDKVIARIPEVRA